VSVIATVTNTVTATIPFSNIAGSVAVTPDGSKVYVVNGGPNSAKLETYELKVVTEKKTAR
jgi:DNA-binding beta-propeller fold protein YncE